MNGVWRGMGWIVAAGVLHGCAGTATTLDRAEVQTVAGSVPLLGEPRTLVLEEALERVWPRVVAAHRAVGFEGGRVDAEAGVVEVGARVVDGSFAGGPVSALLRCGSDPAGTGRDASAVEVLTVTTVRLRSAGTVEVRTRSGGMARSVGASTAAWQMCRTTGELERRVLEHLGGSARIAEGADGDPPPADAPAYEEGRGAAPAVPAPEASPPVPSVVSAAMDSVETGAPLRLVLPWGSVEGGVLALDSAEVTLRTGRRESVVPLWAVEEVQLRRSRRSWAVPGLIGGAVLGAVLFRTTDLGIGGSKPAQGEALNHWLGAIAGGLAGGLIGSQLRGDYWEPIARVEDGS